MPRSTRIAIAAAAVALSAALAGCGGADNDADGTNGTPTATPTPTADPYAFTPVAYPAYSEAARQTGIRPDVVKREYGFNAGLAELCKSTPSQLGELLTELKSTAAADQEPGHTLRAMIDEVSLRLGLSCPQRMSDWIAAGGGSATPLEELEPTEEPEETEEPTGTPDDPSSWSDESGTDSETESGTETGTDSGAESSTGSDTETEADTETGVQTSQVDSGADPGAEEPSDSGS